MMMRIFFIIAYLVFTVFASFAQLPIKVERTISFSTEEGSNMSVDLSPDCKTIVFDLLGDLYTLPLEGGNATQITRGIAVNSYPVWSPKGDKIAFVSDASGDNRLTIIDVLSKATQTFDKRIMGFPVWFGADDWVTATYNFFYDFPLYHSSGGEVKSPQDVYDIVGSSSDNRLVYYRQRVSRKWRIQEYDTATGTKKELAELEIKGGFEGARISKDAHCLSYFLRDGTSCSLLLVDLKTNKERVLANWRQNVSAPLGAYGFSGDSKKIAIGYGGKIHLIELETGRDEIVPFKAEVKVDMGKLNDARFNVSQDSLKVKYMRSAHTSPDGKYLVFSALNRIYIMDLPNGKPRILINQPFNQFHPSWSADGKKITYVSWSDKDFGQVWKVDVDGKSLLQVTQKSGAYYYPCWSPDGTAIAVGKKNFIADKKPLLIGRDGPGIGKLLSINLKDKKVTIIADSIQLINRVVFAADGKSTIYKPDVKNKPGIYLNSINDKKEKRELAIATAPSGVFDELFLRQMIISPDGKYIVYQNEENLYLVPISPTGTSTLLYYQGQKLPMIRFAKGGFDPHWEQGGKVLSWSFANQYFQIDPNKIIAVAIDSAEKRAKSNLPQLKMLDVEITPEKTITIELNVLQKLDRQLLALKNVRIISMKGSEVIEKGTVLIKDGRFLAVDEMDKIHIPVEATVVDLAGKTIIPGLIDLHDHVRPPAEVFPQQKWDLVAGLAYGTTTAREPSGSHDSFGYEELLATGQMTGPRLFNVGYAVREGMYPNINNLEEARNIVQNRARMGAVVVKQYLQPTRLKRQMLLLACQEAGLNMTNESEQSMIGFLGHLKDGTSGVEHNPLWGEAYNDVIQLVSKSGTYLTPTLQMAHAQVVNGVPPVKDQFKGGINKIDKKLTHFYPATQIVQRSLKEMVNNSNEPSFLSQSRVDAAIRHAGGKIPMGSHGEDPGLGAHFETWALQMGGLSNLEALQAATIMAAGALGMQKDLGSIEPGKIADLIVLSKNPLDNIRNTIEIQSVMKDGVLYDGNTLDEIWPVKKKFKYTKSNY